MSLSGVEVPEDLIERGRRMIEPLLRQYAKDKAAGRIEQFTASGIFQHAVLESDRHMVGAMLAAAVVLLGREQTSR